MTSGASSRRKGSVIEREIVGAPTPDPCSPGVLSVFDGTETIGWIVKRSDGFHVITADGQPFGTFDTAIEAARAIPPRQRGTQ